MEAAERLTGLPNRATTGAVTAFSPISFEWLDWSPTAVQIVGTVGAEREDDLLLADVIVVEIR